MISKAAIVDVKNDDLQTLAPLPWQMNLLRKVFRESPSFDQEVTHNTTLHIFSLVLDVIFKFNAAKD